MNKGWIRIYTSAKPLQAEIVKSALQENGINAVLLNKQDSSYNLFGICEIYVPDADVPQAVLIINAEELNKEDISE